MNNLYTCFFFVPYSFARGTDQRQPFPLERQGLVRPIAIAQKKVARDIQILGALPADAPQRSFASSAKNDHNEDSDNNLIAFLI